MSYCKHKHKTNNCIECAIEKQTETIVGAINLLNKPQVIFTPADITPKLKDSFDIMREHINCMVNENVDIAVFIVNYGDLMAGGHTSDEAAFIALRELRE